MNDALKKLLVKQHYHIVGNHSAAKVCHWTKKSILSSGKEYCYKQKFYGIKSHRCLQCTTAVAWCTQRCLFCWRAVEHTLKKKPEWDEPKEIIDGLVEAQRKLLIGYRGFEKADKKLLKEAENPNQVALSLAGESLFYPKMNDLLEEFHKRKFTTFLVTNGTLYKELKNLETEPTQLYVSLCAFDEKNYKKTCNPVIKNAWKNLNKSLELLKSFDCRTVIRMTLVKNLNMMHPEKYAKMIKIADPDFVELKSYMSLGFSRMRLPYSAMPLHAEIKKFAEEIAENSGYEIKDEKSDSRVVLLN